MRTKAIALSLRLITGAAFLAPGAAVGQTTTINTSLCGCQPGPGSPCPGTTNHIVYTFAFNITSGCPSFTAINGFTTSGTYVASDLVNFRLYETNFSVFNTSTLVATITTGLGPGAHTFSGFNRTTCAATQRYYWITATFAAGAVAGHTLNVNLITNAMYAVTGTKNFGTNTAPGTQTVCGTLPVELSLFAGKNENEKNVLEWQTASEVNNDYFTLERSGDGISFSAVAVIDGAGTTSQPNAYSAIDDLDHFSPVTYYRLRQTDFNGEYEYVGGIVAIQSALPGDEVSVYQAENNLLIRQQEGELNYVIYDLSGRRCRSGTIQQNDNTGISLVGLAPGIYTLRLDDKKRTSKLFSKVSD